MESGAQVAGGSIIYPAGYQKAIARLCRSHDVLLILDEIATGFGRLGNMAEDLAQDSQPDIVCFGKALTGGYFPLAVTLTTDSVFNEFLGDYSKNKHLCHGHTYTGNPVGCAAAIANIELYRKQRLIQKIRSNAAYLGSRIKEFWKSAIVADVRHKGLLVGIDLARDGRPLLLLRNREKVNYFVMRESLKRGVHLRPIGNVLLLIPPLAIHREHLDVMIDTYLEIIAEIERL
jgi:adenosylmethionine-8-amino-7-oxononanoate aminotransferase